MTRTLSLALTLIAVTACVPDDVDWQTTDDDSATTPEDDSTVPDDGATAADPALVGSWSSTGNNISSLLSGDPFHIVLVSADFHADGTYDVYSQDADGQGADFSGTYGVVLSTTPHTIVLQQTAPYAATSEGIYQVDSAQLQYEIVQTLPDYGFTPPTAFGTTDGPGVSPGTNVQLFERQ